LNKISIFEQNFNFWTKFQFLNKISIMEQNFNFEQNFNVWTNFQFLNKISVLEQHFNVWTKFQFLTKISIFIQNLDKISFLRITFFAAYTKVFSAPNSHFTHNLSLRVKLVKSAINIIKCRICKKQFHYQIVLHTNYILAVM